jgi:cation transport ATPase
MRLYILYALVLAGVTIASISAVSGVPERMKRWLIAAIALLVIVPGALFLIFNPTA